MLSYGELVDGSRKIGCPFLRYKDTIKDILKFGDALHKWKEGQSGKAVFIAFPRRLTLTERSLIKGQEPTSLERKEVP